MLNKLKFLSVKLVLSIFLLYSTFSQSNELPNNSTYKSNESTIIKSQMQNKQSSVNNNYLVHFGPPYRTDGYNSSNSYLTLSELITDWWLYYGRTWGPPVGCNYTVRNYPDWQRTGVVASLILDQIHCFGGNFVFATRYICSENEWWDNNKLQCVNSTKPNPQDESGDYCSIGMPKYRFDTKTTNLIIEDIPLACNSPKGPSTSVRLTYSYLDPFTSYASSDISPQWQMHNLSWIEFNPANLQSVQLWSNTGGNIKFSEYNSANQSYKIDAESLAKLAILSTNPIRFERTFINGKREIYSYIINGETTNRAYLSQIYDETNNAVSFEYDANQRLQAWIDSLGRKMQVEYLDGNSRQINYIRDSYGRFVAFEYD